MRYRRRLRLTSSVAVLISVPVACGPPASATGCHLSHRPSPSCMEVPSLVVSHRQTQPTKCRNLLTNAVLQHAFLGRSPHLKLWSPAFPGLQGTSPLAGFPWLSARMGHCGAPSTRTSTDGQATTRTRVESAVHVQCWVASLTRHGCWTASHARPLGARRMLEPLTHRWDPARSGW